MSTEKMKREVRTLRSLAEPLRPPSQEEFEEFLEQLPPEEQAAIEGGRSADTTEEERREFLDLLYELREEGVVFPTGVGLSYRFDPARPRHARFLELLDLFAARHNPEAALPYRLKRDLLLPKLGLPGPVIIRTPRWDPPNPYTSPLAKAARLRGRAGGARRAALMRGDLAPLTDPAEAERRYLEIGELIAAKQVEEEQGGEPVEAVEGEVLSLARR